MKVNKENEENKSRLNKELVIKLHKENGKENVICLRETRTHRKSRRRKVLAEICKGNRKRKYREMKWADNLCCRQR